MGPILTVLLVFSPRFMRGILAVLLTFSPSITAPERGNSDYTESRSNPVLREGTKPSPTNEPPDNAVVLNATWYKIAKAWTTTVRLICKCNCESAGRAQFHRAHLPGK